MLKIIPTLVSKIFYHNQSADKILPPVIKRCYSSYNSSKPLPKPEDRPKFEVTQNEEDWKYVERLLPLELIPQPIPKDQYPSGWVPPKFDGSSPYLIQRTKNGMLPIYLQTTHRGLKRLTKVRLIHGDLYAFARDLQQYLQQLKGKKIYLRIHELCQMVVVHGDHVSDAKVFALKRKM